MRKLIALLSAAMLVTPAFAGGTVALNDAEPEAIQQAPEWRWAIEVEAGYSEFLTRAGGQSLTTDFSSDCQITTPLCFENTSSSFYGLAIFFNVNERYSVGLRHQEMNNLYEMTTIYAGETGHQDTKLTTVSLRRHFNQNTTMSPFLEFGLGRYSSSAEYSYASTYLKDKHSGWTPVLGAGAIVQLSDYWSLVPSIRYIGSVGERSHLMGGNWDNIKTVDEPVTQLSIGLRFEL